MNPSRKESEFQHGRRKIFAHLLCQGTTRGTFWVAGRKRLEKAGDSGRYEFPRRDTSVLSSNPKRSCDNGDIHAKQILVPVHDPYQM
jgi:hypothetical protein